MKIINLVISSLLLVLVGCSNTPSIDAVQEATAECAKTLLTEDNNSERYIRMDRYFLDEKPDDLTYTGHIKATIFYMTDGLTYSYPFVRRYLDSLKVYKDVTVRFRDKKYNAYTITIQ